MQWKEVKPVEGKESGEIQKRKGIEEDGTEANRKVGVLVQGGEMITWTKKQKNGMH